MQIKGAFSRSRGFLFGISASALLLAQWPVPRQDERGIISDQIRGND